MVWVQSDQWEKTKGGQNICKNKIKLIKIRQLKFVTYGAPGLKRRWGPIAPKMMDEVAKIVDCGHMKLCFW